MKNILSFCNEDIETKRDRLWKSIKVTRTIGPLETIWVAYTVGRDDRYFSQLVEHFDASIVYSWPSWSPARQRFHRFHSHDVDDDALMYFKTWNLKKKSKNLNRWVTYNSHSSIISSELTRNELNHEDRAFDDTWFIRTMNDIGRVGTRHQTVLYPDVEPSWSGWKLVGDNVHKQMISNGEKGAYQEYLNKYGTPTSSRLEDYEVEFEDDYNWSQVHKKIEEERDSPQWVNEYWNKIYNIDNINGLTRSIRALKRHL